MSARREMHASKRGVAARVGRDVLEGLERRPHLGGRLRGEPAEQVVLARGVLVDRDPRAAGQLGDAVERRAVVAGLAERLERSVEDALVGSQPSRADRRAVCVRRPAGRGWHGLAGRWCAHPLMLRLSNENVNRRRTRSAEPPENGGICVTTRVAVLTPCAFGGHPGSLPQWSSGTYDVEHAAAPCPRAAGSCA